MIMTRSFLKDELNYLKKKEFNDQKFLSNIIEINILRDVSLFLRCQIRDQDMYD